MKQLVATFRWDTEVRSWALVSALLQVGWRLSLEAHFSLRPDGTSNVREVWVLASPDVGKGAGQVKRVVAMRTAERMRKAGRIVPCPTGSDEWVRGAPPPPGKAK